MKCSEDFGSQPANAPPPYGSPQGVVMVQTPMQQPLGQANPNYSFSHIYTGPQPVNTSVVMKNNEGCCCCCCRCPFWVCGLIFLAIIGMIIGLVSMLK